LLSSLKHIIVIDEFFYSSPNVNNQININIIMLITYSFLIAAVALGTASNIFAKEAEGFTKLFPSLLSALTIVLCMYCLSQVMKTISAGYTYATFAGLCIIATTIIGILRFNQWPNFYAFIGLIFIIIGVVLVNLLGKN
jgi:small multidrug resistance pump